MHWWRRENVKQSISIHGYSKQEPFFNMVFRGLISNENRAFIRLLQRSGKSQREIAATCNVSRSSVQRICQRQGQVHRCRQRGRGGRKRLISKRQERLLVRNNHELRKTEGSFTSARVKSACGLMHVSDRTMRRAMNRLGFKYRQARKKGLVTDLDLKKRVRFAKKMTRQYPPNVWTEVAG